MENISYIIPVDDFNEEIETLLERALKSLNAMSNTKKTRVIVVGPNNILDKVSVVCNECKCKQTLIMVPNEDVDVFTQINKGVMQCTTEYFSVLEYDDAFYPYWAKCVERYIKAGENASIYMPINELVDANNPEAIIGTNNEIALANSYTNNYELGFLDIDSLEDYIEFNVTGAIIKTEDFIAVGRLKPSLKIASWYEFLLRMAYNHKIIRVLPKIGYIHTVGRKNSYSEKMRDVITPEHASFLLTTAKQEYFFKEDRNKSYEK